MYRTAVARSKGGVGRCVVYFLISFRDIIMRDLIELVGLIHKTKLKVGGALKFILRPLAPRWRRLYEAIAQSGSTDDDAKDLFKSSAEDLKNLQLEKQTERPAARCRVPPRLQGSSFRATRRRFTSATKNGRLR